MTSAGGTGAYSETGDPVLGLTFALQAVRLLTGDLGVHGDYSSALGGPSFTSAALPIDHDSLDLGLGAEWRAAKGGYRFAFDYDGEAPTRQEAEHRILLEVDMPLN